MFMKSQNSALWISIFPNIRAQSARKKLMRRALLSTRSLNALPRPRKNFSRNSATSVFRVEGHVEFFKVTPRASRGRLEEEVVDFGQFYLSIYLSICWSAAKRTADTGKRPGPGVASPNQAVETT